MCTAALREQLVPRRGKLLVQVSSLCCDVFSLLHFNAQRLDSKIVASFAWKPAPVTVQTSENHRMVRVGTNPKDHPVPTPPCHGHLLLDQVDLNRDYLFPRYLQIFCCCKTNTGVCLCECVRGIKPRGGHRRKECTPHVHTCGA